MQPADREQQTLSRELPDFPETGLFYAEEFSLQRKIVVLGLERSHQIAHRLDLFGPPCVGAAEGIAVLQFSLEGVVERQHDAVGARAWSGTPYRRRSRGHSARLQSRRTPLPGENRRIALENATQACFALAMILDRDLHAWLMDNSKMKLVLEHELKPNE